MSETIQDLGLTDAEKIQRARILVRTHAVFAELTAPRCYRTGNYDDDGEWVESPIPFYRCSTESLDRVSPTPEVYIKMLLDAGYLQIRKKGSMVDGASEYFKIRDLESELDESDLHIQMEIEYLQSRPIKKFRKYNNPEGWSIALPEGWENLLERSPFQTKSQFTDYVGYLTKIFDRLNAGKTEELMGQVALCGRICHSLTQTPRRLRRYMRIRNGKSKIAEVDINATIPRLLGITIKRLVERDLANAQRRWREAQEAGKPVQYHGQVNADGEPTGIVLALLAEIEEYRSMIDYTDAYMRLKETLELNLTRDEIKTEFLPVVFGRIEEDEANGIRAYIATKFKKRFPRMYGYIKTDNLKYRNAKDKGRISIAKQSITSKIFELESRIIRDVSKEFISVPRLTLFDALLIDAKYQNTINERMKTVFEELAETPYVGKAGVIQEELTRVELEEKFSVWKKGEIDYLRITVRRDGKQKAFAARRDSTDGELTLLYKRAMSFKRDGEE